MAVSAVLRLVYFARPLTIGTQGAHQRTQAVPPARRDALCPSPKISKQAAFGIRSQMFSSNGDTLHIRHSARERHGASSTHSQRSTSQ